jgi:hypothetical protein
MENKQITNGEQKRISGANIHVFNMGYTYTTKV